MHATIEELWFSVARDTAVSGQELVKHVPVATDKKATIEERCFLRRPSREVITRTAGAISSVEFFTGGCEDRTSGREAKESPLLEAVARERLVKTAGWKSLSGCCGDLQSV
jgi:hypothetical protein